MPPPSHGEILLRLRHVGLCGTDLFKLATRSEPAGTVLGHELVGSVEALGEGVEGFARGDRVVVPHHVACGDCVYCREGSETMCPVFKENLMSPGGFSELILIKQRAVEHAAYKIPDQVSDEQAVFVEPASCVLRGVSRSGLSAGGKAAVLGCGSMGLLHLLVLKAACPECSVLMVDPDPERRQLAASLGADEVSEPGDAAAQIAKQMTDATGVDAVFDTVGGSGTLNAGLGLCRAGGSIVLFAHAPHNAFGDIDLNSLFKKEQRIISTYSGALAEQRRVFDLICDGKLDPSPLVTHHMPLAEFQRGVDLAVGQKALKVLYTPGQ